MCALAASNLPLVHPSSQNTLTLQDPPVQQTLNIFPNVSPGRNPDGSVCGVADMNLSLIHPSDASRGDREYLGLAREPDSLMVESSSMSRFPRSPSVSMEFDAESKRDVQLSMEKSLQSNEHSHEDSMMSISSVGSIINSGTSDPFGYRDEVSGPPQIPLPPAPSQGPDHSDSNISFLSMSSLGRIIRPGKHNPFGYATTDDSHTSLSQTMDLALCVDDSNLPEQKTKSRESSDPEKSKPPSLLPPTVHGHFRDDSAMSITSLGPPVSFHNASYRRHQRNRSSNDSGGSVTHPYNVFGANRGRAKSAKHQSDASIDSFASDSSMPRFERPGLGDKMLDSAADYRGIPLTSISASPGASEMADIPI